MGGHLGGQDRRRGEGAPGRLSWIRRETVREIGGNVPGHDAEGTEGTRVAWMGMSAVLVPAKPRLRGRIHQVAFFVSIPAGVLLIVLAQGVAETTAAVIYAVSLSAVFGASASYHVGTWSKPALRRMKRLDHSMIFVLIAGSYTPITLLVLHGAWSVVILSLIWTMAALGITLEARSDRRPLQARGHPLHVDGMAGRHPVPSAVPGALDRGTRAARRRWDSLHAGCRRVRQTEARLRTRPCSGTTRCGTRSSSRPRRATGR